VVFKDQAPVIDNYVTEKTKDFEILETFDELREDD
jgi:hypothetical protein